jgi:hypothetical protein
MQQMTHGVKMEEKPFVVMMILTGIMSGAKMGYLFNIINKIKAI